MLVVFILRDDAFCVGITFGACRPMKQIRQKLPQLSIKSYLP